MTNSSITKIMQQHKHQKGLEALTHARSILEKAIHEIDIYIGYLEKADSDSEKARFMNWALHYLASNILPNVRLDLIADAQAEFSQPVTEIVNSDDQLPGGEE